MEQQAPSVPEVKLSYSSASLLMNCELRYAHKKVYNTPIDSDTSEDTLAFNVGKAFHKVMENLKHTLPMAEYKTTLYQEVINAVKEFGVTNEWTMIYAMCMKYLDLSRESGLSAVACEIQVNSFDTNGFIDVILVDEAGFWFIGDMKTSSRWDTSVLPKLPFDYQLNLYSSFADRIAAGLGLDPKKFRGCRYRVTTKSKIVRKSSEGDFEYAQRLYLAHIESWDVIVPKEVMHIEEITSLHKDNHQRAVELMRGEAPRKNLQYCDSYHKGCEYWSKCRGSTRSDSFDLVDIRNAEMYRKERQELEDML